MKKPRNTALLRVCAKYWTKFEPVEVTLEMRGDYPLLKNVHSIYVNSRFEVQLFAVESSIGGVMQVGICRHGDIEPATWEEMQRIKTELFGPDAVAVEVYPSLVNEWKTKTGVRVLWVLPSTYTLPFGLEKIGAWGKNHA